MSCAPILSINFLAEPARDPIYREHDETVKYSFLSTSYQHLGMSLRTNRPVSCPTHSSPRNHCHNNNPPFSKINFKSLTMTIMS